MAELKIGRNLFEITERDVVMFNGACWQLISQKIQKGWDELTPRMSKALCENFVKKGILVMFKKQGEYLTQTGQQMGLYYYKFDMEKLTEHLKV